jgi:hypothetical protein
MTKSNKCDFNLMLLSKLHPKHHAPKPPYSSGLANVTASTASQCAVVVSVACKLVPIKLFKQACIQKNPAHIQKTYPNICFI